MSTPAEVATANGLANAQTAWDAAVAVGVPYWATCAFLEQESGGRNIFGHDGGASGWFSGRGEVTETNYAEYKAGRDAGKGAQGVGPMQLTYGPFQDEADALGGCWEPAHNITVGLSILKRIVAAGKTWHQAAAAYNGSEAYAVQMDARFTRWQQLLAGADEGGPVDIYVSMKYPGTDQNTCIRDLQALDAFKAELGYKVLTIVKGCYVPYSPQSSYTHSGSSVYDLSDNEYARKAEIGAKHGIIVFHRPLNWDGKGGEAHCHVIVRGGQKMHPEAKAQVVDWDQHKDGLADHGPYTTGPWFPVKPFVYHAPKQPPPPPPPPPPGHLWPILDTPREKLWAAFQSLEAGVASLEAVVAAHPNWQFGKDMMAVVKDSAATVKAQWNKLRDTQTPK